MSRFNLRLNVTNNIITPGIIYILSILIILISLAIIVLFINIVLNIVLNIVIGEKAARCNAVIAMTTRDENFNKDILLGNKDIPSTYRSCHIDANILSVVVDDNLKFFPNLKVEKYYEKPKGRGRTKLGGYIFTYDRPKNINKYKPLEVDKEKDFEEEQRLDYKPESKTEMDMFPENVPFFD